MQGFGGRWKDPCGGMQREAALQACAAERLVASWVDLVNWGGEQE